VRSPRLVRNNLPLRVRGEVSVIEHRVDLSFRYQCHKLTYSGDTWIETVHRSVLHPKSEVREHQQSTSNILA
jgi:hypothetical protein